MGLLENLRRASFHFRRIPQLGFGDGRPVSPLLLAPLEKETRYTWAVHPDVQLQIQVKSRLIPRGVGGPSAVAQHPACLLVALQGVEGCRMLESAQGIRKSGMRREMNSSRDRKNFLLGKTARPHDVGGPFWFSDSLVN